MPRAQCLIDAQKRYALKHRELIYERKRRWLETKDTRELGLKYYPIHKRKANYEPVRIERLTYSWIRFLFKD